MRHTRRHALLSRALVAIATLLAAASAAPAQSGGSLEFVREVVSREVSVYLPGDGSGLAGGANEGVKEIVSRETSVYLAGEGDGVEGGSNAGVREIVSREVATYLPDPNNGGSGGSNEFVREVVSRELAVYLPIGGDGSGQGGSNEFVREIVSRELAVYLPIDGNGSGAGGSNEFVREVVSRELAVYLPVDGNGSGAGGSNEFVRELVSREFAVYLNGPDGNTPGGSPALVHELASREITTWVDTTDANDNGVPDLLEPGLVTNTYYANTVSASSTAWRDEGEATGNPGCLSACDCNETNGQYAYNGSPGAPGSAGYFPGDQSPLELAFPSIALAPGRVVSSIYIDVVCRYNIGTTGTVRTQAVVNGTSLLSKDVTFDSAETCEYRYGITARVVNTPPGGWTADGLSNLRVHVSRTGSNSTSLRVKAVRVTVNTIEQDTDRDGISDSFDNCPTVQNPSQADCDDPDNGIGDACELLVYPQRDANLNGVVDACEGVAGWIGGSSGSFTSAANWSSGSVPGPGTRVYLGAPNQGGSITVSTAGAVDIDSLIVTRGTVRLNLGGTMRVSNEFIVASGAALIVDGVGGVSRTLEVAGAGRVAGGAKLELAANATLRALAGGSFTTSPLSTLAVVLRGGAEVPVELLGAVVLDGGFSAKLGSLGDADLPLGRTFTVITSAQAVESFYSALTAQGLLKKFLLVLAQQQQQLGFGSLVLQVADLKEFIRAAGGEDTTLAGGVQPTAIVARNFDTPAAAGQQPDLFDDIAVTAKRTDALGQQLPGTLYVFKSNGTGGSSAQGSYPTGREPVAVESEDLDGDGSFDLAVLTRTEGLLELYLNLARDVTNFTVGDSEPVGVGARYFGIDDITLAALAGEQLISRSALLIGNPLNNTLQSAIVVGGQIQSPPPPPVGVPTSPGPLSPIGPGGTSRDDGAFLVTRSAPVDSEYGFVTRYVVDSNGSISSPPAASVFGPGQPTGIALDRLNSDDLVDMVVTGLTPEEFGSAAGVFVYAGVGTTTSGFASGGQLPLEQRPLDVAIGDFNADGKQDFAVAMGTVAGAEESGTNVRRFNNATVSLENPVFESGPDDILFDGQGVRRIRAADLNALPPDDYAVLGETITGGGAAALAGGGGGAITGFVGGRLFEPTQQPPCIGDTDGDGIVNGNDLASLLGNWGSTGVADLDGSGVIDASDLAVMLGAWGACAQE
jgi:hypothetical protein